MNGILQQPHHMYANATVQFRDPFAQKATHNHPTRANWSSFSQRPDFPSTLTPPPEMNAVSQTSKPSYYQQEHGQHYSDRRAPVAYVPQVTYVQHRHSGVATQPSGTAMSPVSGPRQPIFDDYQSQSWRESQVNAIAPSFQIPRSVNDSGGSLSELAAQITCLFWFESADVLKAVEGGQLALCLPRQLVLDAKPTTGFRKWVTTILSTTLVAQNVVLLALLFIYRLKKLNPTVRGKPGSEYRLLTVALMLANKFLDDNTYTNKTWAEVSGIVVGEVHIMEVEFLSNMKYCLFTSAEDWAKWQSLLGKFASFFDKASRPQPPAPILPPASSLHLPMALPSPPISNHASPPYAAEQNQNVPTYSAAGQHGPTPAPSPLAALPVPDLAPYQRNPGKRSYEDQGVEPARKRVASGYQSYASNSAYGNAAASRLSTQQMTRLTLPNVAIPASSGTYQSPMPTQQLPPLNVPARAMAKVYPNSTTPASAPQLPALATSTSQTPSQMPSQYHLTQHSPYPGSAQASPTSAVPHSGLSLHPAAQISPTYFLRQRTSPYRPVHNVQHLLCPPPSSALQQRSQTLEHSQMHYQPLGKPFQQQQTGRLPYVAQNVWMDGNQHQHPMTPVHQWPSFTTAQQQQQQWQIPPQR